ncbi:MAG TPA: hypothetical protein VFA89_15150 [Terriglobales bacterium]|nr:hypothetical protein [Terriglobales bacterium]
MNPALQAKDLSAEWQEARLLYPLYAALAKEFVIDVPACADLEMGVEAPPKESVEQARLWLSEVDGRIEVHQLRQFLQTTTLVTQDSLQRLLTHHLQKPEKAASDRDKIDFLLVQFFAHCAPSGLDENDVDLDYVAQVLEPVLGQVELTVPVWLKGLEQLVQSARQCRRLSELLHSGILEQGRRLKVQCGDKYFLPVAMVAFARFSFLMRRVFFHLMHGDLNAILDGLRELEQRGVQTLDCRRAQFSAEEPTARLRMICQSWKVMFFAEYSSGQPLRMLVDLRAAIEDALSAGAKGNAASAKAAAAGASTGKSRIVETKARDHADAAPEFEVSPSTQVDE